MRQTRLERRKGGREIGRGKKGVKRKRISFASFYGHISLVESLYAPVAPAIARRARDVRDGIRMLRTDEEVEWERERRRR
jgi:hypothetical protein